MFVRKQGKTKFMWYPMTASTVALKGALMALASGKIVPATNTQKAYYIVGVLRHTIATTDANYTSERLVEVEVPVEKNVIWKADVTDGTLATTSVGLYFDLSTDDTGIGVDQGASAENVCFCTKFLTTALGEFILNMGPEACGDID